ncbi:hypothetical protein [Sporomusa sphaeroides]|uniref:Uncharacterized protein n=1 Tax=Sporomusa sphaeroides DSM 2875 TaxID=1337886 RepID=A0ABP2CC00_9FIRM|nr:hypothetical protein [Sporomusa sphaeroides]OLS57678.1 hypothetical protein SPSPH_12060 [Sporomusa sphaeroides DSM 2875]CVK21765.1 hypothetical protein SSPH_04483 [Sporomusa sphaeroides DSM 2875]
MTKLEKGMMVLESVKAPTGSLAKIIYEGQGQGTQYGTTLFHVFLDGMSYGTFAMRGNITTLEEAQTKLSSPRQADEQESLAEYAVYYQWMNMDVNEFYDSGS